MFKHRHENRGQKTQHPIWVVALSGTFALDRRRERINEIERINTRLKVKPGPKGSQTKDHNGSNIKSEANVSSRIGNGSRIK